MKIKNFAAVIALFVSTNSFSADIQKITSSAVQGAWQCSSVLPVSWVDAVTIYAPDGNYSGVGNSLTIHNIGAEQVEYDIFVSGSWVLEENKLITDAYHLEVVPKNTASEKYVEDIKKAISTPSMLHSEVDVVFLDETKLRTKDEDGQIRTCYKAISALKVKE